MAHISASGCGSGTVRPVRKTSAQKVLQRGTTTRRLIFIAAMVLLSPLLFAQSTPQITGVEPPSGKVNDTVTISGQNLGKDAVSAVYLSDDKNDYRATVVDQGAEKIVVKVPQVKSGNYNVSIQVGDKLFIKPVRFKVQE
jgi:IPT/TIG domain